MSVSARQRNHYIAAGLGAACKSNDTRVLRDLLRTVFGPDLREMVMRSSADIKYVIDDASLKERVKTLPLLCTNYGSVECLELLNTMLPGSVDPNCTDRDGTPCLHLAIKNNHEEMAALLVEMGADVDGRDKQLRSPAHWAVVCLMVELLPRLAVKKANLSCQDAAGASPLHCAAQMCGHSEFSSSVTLDCLRQLLRLKPDVNARDNKGRTPLMWAAGVGSVGACKMLIAAGAAVDAVDEEGSSALHLAARKGSTATASALVKSGAADVNLRDGRGQTAVSVALNGKKVDCLLELLKLGASETLDDGGKSIAHLAAASGDLDLVKKLLAAGCQFWKRTQRGELPVHYAIIAKRDDVACHLLLDEKRGRPRGAVMKTCVHMATRTNNLPLVKRLLEMGADVNALLTYQDKKLTPLDVAAEQSLHDCADYLRQRGGLPSAALVDKSAAVIQRAVRRAAARKKRRAQLAARAAQHELLHKSAAVLQRALRRLLAARRLMRLRAERERDAEERRAADEERRALEERSAAVIQRAARRLASTRKRRREERAALEDRCARVLQRAVRRFAEARKRARWTVESEAGERAERAARIIQRTLRRVAAVRAMNELRRRHESARVIQRAVRRLAARKRMRALAHERAARESAAFVVQRAMRRFSAMKTLPEIQRQLAERRRRLLQRTHAATILQRAMRRLVAIRKLQGAASGEEVEEEEERKRRELRERSAFTLQRAMRRLVAGRKLQRALLERQAKVTEEEAEEEKERKQRELRERSAAVLQRAVRRLLALRRFETRHRQKRRDALLNESALVLQRALRRFVAQKSRRAHDRSPATSLSPVAIAPSTATVASPSFSEPDEESVSVMTTSRPPHEPVSDGSRASSPRTSLPIVADTSSDYDAESGRSTSPLPAVSPLAHAAVAAKRGRSLRRATAPRPLLPQPRAPPTGKRQSSKSDGKRLKPLDLSDAYRYYVSKHQYELLFEKPVSETLKMKVQRSVREHEAWKAIGKGYKVAHTRKTVASIPSFPIISPVKYLTAADSR